jgi:hypothetical protein
MTSPSTGEAARQTPNARSPRLSTCGTRGFLTNVKTNVKGVNIRLIDIRVDLCKVLVALLDHPSHPYTVRLRACVPGPGWTLPQAEWVTPGAGGSDTPVEGTNR